MLVMHVACLIAIMGLSYPAAQHVLVKLGEKPSPHDEAITQPSSYVPFNHQIFMCFLLFRICLLYTSIEPFGPDLVVCGERGAVVKHNATAQSKGPVSYTHLDVYKRQVFDHIGYHDRRNRGDRLGHHGVRSIQLDFGFLYLHGCGIHDRVHNGNRLKKRTR